MSLDKRNNNNKKLPTTCPKWNPGKIAKQNWWLTQSSLPLIKHLVHSHSCMQNIYIPTQEKQLKTWVWSQYQTQSPGTQDNAQWTLHNLSSIHSGKGKQRTVILDKSKILDRYFESPYPGDEEDSLRRPWLFPCSQLTVVLWFVSWIFFFLSIMCFGNT